jgi:hypothetical protein
MHRRVTVHALPTVTERRVPRLRHRDRAATSPTTPSPTIAAGDTGRAGSDPIATANSENRATTRRRDADRGCASEHKHARRGGLGTTETPGETPVGFPRGSSRRFDPVEASLGGAMRPRAELGVSSAGSLRFAVADRKDLEFTYSLIDRIFRLSLGELADFSGASTTAISRCRWRNGGRAAPKARVRRRAYWDRTWPQDARSRLRLGAAAPLHP